MGIVDEKTEQMKVLCLLNSGLRNNLGPHAHVDPGIVFSWNGAR